MRLIGIASVLLLVSTTPAVAGHDHPMPVEPRSASAASVSPLVTGVLAATLAQALVDSAEVASENHTASAEKAHSPKSPSKALSLSLVSTGVPLIIGLGLAVADAPAPADTYSAILILGGVVVGPSVGHFYAGNTGHGVLTIGLRSVGLAGGTLGLYLWAIAEVENVESVGALGIIIFVPSAALMLGSAVYDIATASGAARKYNEKKRLSRFSIGPTYIAAESTPGIAVKYRF
jgi:hypothetical protein